MIQIKRSIVLADAACRHGPTEGSVEQPCAHTLQVKLAARAANEADVHGGSGSFARCRKTHSPVKTFTGRALLGGINAVWDAPFTFLHEIQDEPESFH